MGLRDNALTTLATAKSWLKIAEATTSDDAIVELIVNAASQSFEVATNRKIKLQDVTEVRHGKAGNIMLLREWPVVSVTSVKVDNSSVFTSADSLLAATDYTIGDNAQSLVFHSTNLPRGYNNVQIVYRAGYDEIPADIEMAVLWACSWLYNIRKSDDIGRSSKGKGDESVAWGQDAPEYVLKTIANYKRTEFPAGDAIERNL